MFCTRCGAAVSEGTAFCTSCGSPMQANQPAPPPAYQPPPQDYQTAPTPPLAPPEIPEWPQPPQALAPFPEQVAAPRFPYARWWPRFVAYLLDSLILGAVALVIAGIVFLLIGGSALISGSETPQDFGAALGAAAILLIVFAYLALIVVMWLYFAKMESSEKQATIGKKALGIYVTDLNGQRLSFGRASGRFFAKIVTGLIPLSIGWIMADFTEKEQALHDKIAGTLVWKRQ